MKGDLGSLAGLPLAEQMRILQETGLVVEDAHANGVKEVYVTGSDSETKKLQVKPLVVWNRSGNVQTVYLPK